MEKKKNHVHIGTAKKILEWCKLQYGRSNYNGNYPIVSFKKLDEYAKDDYGYYDDEDNVLKINSKLNKSLEDLAQTIIHEYVHYRYHSMSEYNRLAEIHSDFDHPHEVEAREIEARDYKICLEYLKIMYGIE